MSAATVKHLDPTQVELEIAIPLNELDAARERAFRELSRNVKLPGFRPGKVPRKIFEAQYGTSAIEQRAMDALVPSAYSKALEENDLFPVDEPQMELLPREEESSPLRVRATVAVRPSIELKEYKGVELIGTPIAISDADVETALQGLRRDAAILIPVDRPVQFGDVPTIDYEGTIEGAPFEGGKAENRPTEIDKDHFISGFAEGVVGMKAGESRDVEAHFPGDYANKELAGKTAVFHITVHENKERELPELDDALAQRYGGENATLGTLRDDLRNRLEANARTRRRRELTGPLLDKLAAAHEVALPDVLVERNAEALYDEAKGYIDQAGLDWAKYLEEQGKTEEQLRAEYRAEAERRVRSTLLLESIAKAEHIEATPDDIDAEVRQLQRQYAQPREAIVEMLRENFGALVSGIVRTKTIEFLIDNAKVTESPVAPLGAGGAPGEATSASPA